MRGGEVGVHQYLAVAEPAHLTQPAFESGGSRCRSITESPSEAQRSVATELSQHPLDVARQALARLWGDKVVRQRVDEFFNLCIDREHARIVSPPSDIEIAAATLVAVGGPARRCYSHAYCNTDVRALSSSRRQSAAPTSVAPGTSTSRPVSTS